MIRKYKPEDIERVWELYKNYSPYPAPYWQMKEAIDSGGTIVYSDSREIQGFLISLIDQSDPWVWSIVTHRFKRGQGIGTALLKETENNYIARGYKQLCLFVSPDNPAQKLYFDLGYRVVEIVNSIYDHPALKMVKNI